MLYKICASSVALSATTVLVGCGNGSKEDVCNKYKDETKCTDQTDKCAWIEVNGKGQCNSVTVTCGSKQCKSGQTCQDNKCVDPKPPITNACSAANPKGMCDGGKICDAGSCKDPQEAPCGKNNFVGTCKTAGDECFESIASSQIVGVCKDPKTQPCTWMNLVGRCTTEGEVCDVDGSCRAPKQSQCSKDNLGGKCDDPNQKCFEGQCQIFCSKNNPVGKCEGKNQCFAGECQDPTTQPCSINNNVGTCTDDNQKCSYGRCQYLCSNAHPDGDCAAADTYCAIPAGTDQPTCKKIADITQCSEFNQNSKGCINMKEVCDWQSGGEQPNKCVAHKKPEGENL